MGIQCVTVCEICTYTQTDYVIAIVMANNKLL